MHVTRYKIWALWDFIKPKWGSQRNLMQKSSIIHKEKSASFLQPWWGKGPNRASPHKNICGQAVSSEPLRFQTASPALCSGFKPQISKGRLFIHDVNWLNVHLRDCIQVFVRYRITARGFFLSDSPANCSQLPASLPSCPEIVKNMKLSFQCEFCTSILIMCYLFLCYQKLYITLP